MLMNDDFFLTRDRPGMKADPASEKYELNLAD
jgi:hypothetical protein